MKQSEIVLAGATAAVVSVALIWSYGIQPTVRTWKDAVEREGMLKEKLARYESLVGRAQELRGERAAIDLALAPPASSDDPDAGGDATGSAIAGFLSHVRSLTDASGIKPSVLRYVRAEALPVDGKDAFAELRFELKARAPLKQIHDFLVRMAASEWYLRVQSLTLTPRENGELEADMSLIALASKDTLDTDDQKRRPR